MTNLAIIVLALSNNDNSIESAPKVPALGTYFMAFSALAMLVTGTAVAGTLLTVPATIPVARIVYKPVETS